MPLILSCTTGAERRRAKLPPSFNQDFILGFMERLSVMSERILDECLDTKEKSRLRKMRTLKAKADKLTLKLGVALKVK